MAKKVYLSGTYAYNTHTGKIRLSNEDRVGVFINTKGNILLVVCDGMGGQNKGEYAATIALSYIKDSFLKKSKFISKFDAAIWLRRIVTKANREVFEEASKDDSYKGMGTTLTAVLIVRDTCFCIQIGDSRAYVLRNRQLEQITEDQSLVYYLYRTGKITQEEMKTHPKRHVLMNALGIFPSVDFEFKRFPYMNESIMVCSDGLYNNVSQKDIAAILKGEDNTEEKVNELINLANANGGSDNIAIALWEGQQ